MLPSVFRLLPLKHVEFTMHWTHTLDRITLVKNLQMHVFMCCVVYPWIRTNELYHYQDVDSYIVKEIAIKAS